MAVSKEFKVLYHGRQYVAVEFDNHYTGSKLIQIGSDTSRIRGYSSVVNKYLKTKYVHNVHPSDVKRIVSKHQVGGLVV